MSAVLRDVPRPGSMTDADLADVLVIERAVYTHPWSQGNFADSLRAGYECRTLRVAGMLAGYFILAVAAGEAHLLNLSVAPAQQRHGYGTALLREGISIARSHGAKSIFLEVRPGNAVAQALYARFDFRQIAVRRDYYPVAGGREDAYVYRLDL
ncbi:MAG: ribosomal protein S18-alanine N-acetyltransferase [Burkholderiales bacterium]